MDIVNQKIIDAIIAKANMVCPNSLALIGVYGSVATGDVYNKSDLDLMILINDDAGWKLGTGFILNDSNIGYDIYCTNWEGLEYEAECNNAHLSKLLNSKIVYVNDEDALAKLESLQKKALAILSSDERFTKANNLLNNAKNSYAEVCLTDDLGSVRLYASYVILDVLDALMIYNGSYFKRGIKRTFEELDRINVDDEFKKYILNIALSNNIDSIRNNLKNILKCTANIISIKPTKEEPTCDSLGGTYEEMYSNWRNKVEEAKNNNDAYASFMNMCSLQSMLCDIEEELNIGIGNFLNDYDTTNLSKNVLLYDAILAKYELIYNKANKSVRRYNNVNEFVDDYLNK